MSAYMYMSQRCISKCLGIGKHTIFRTHVARSRSFSVTAKRNSNTLMETSGFSEIQLSVREAIAKICSNFPDVSRKRQDRKISFKTWYRSTGRLVMNRESILMSYIELCRKMDGLALRYLRILVDLDWEFQKQP